MSTENSEDTCHLCQAESDSLASCDHCHVLVCENCVGHSSPASALTSGETVCQECVDAEDIEGCAHCGEENGEGAQPCCQCGAEICADCWGDLRPGYGPQLKSSECEECGAYLCSSCAETIEDFDEDAFVCADCSTSAAS